MKNIHNLGAPSKAFEFGDGVEVYSAIGVKHAINAMEAKIHQLQNENDQLALKYQQQGYEKGFLAGCNWFNEQVKTCKPGINQVLEQAKLGAKP